ncbi:MAG: CBS domain-containing protein [Nitrospira sp. CR1.3]|nr:CBS domain-containing protein [Nitrospira sp. CR1.3]
MAGLEERPPKKTATVPIVVAHMMTPGVVQVPGDVSVSEAALMLEREQAPCLLVKDTETRFGVMTPTDIVRKVVAQGLEPHEIEVRTIMTRPVQFIEYDEALEEASTLMLATGASLLIVTKQNQPVGVLTAHDLMLTPPRRATKIPAVVTVMGDEPAEPRALNAVILQLSHLGALVQSGTRVAARSRIVLAFSLPGQNTPLTIHGKILNSDLLSAEPNDASGKRLAAAEIQFIDPSNANLARLKAWALQALPSSPQRS